MVLAKAGISAFSGVYVGICMLQRGAVTAAFLCPAVAVFSVRCGVGGLGVMDHVLWCDEMPLVGPGFTVVVCGVGLS